MRTIEYRSWKRFRDFLLEYSTLDRDRRGQLLFRGQADSKWRLNTTFDRVWTFSDDHERDNFYWSLIREFRREALSLGAVPPALPENVAFELLARHHGVPSVLLDWTESPYIASFFAFEGAKTSISHSVAIWVLDRTRYDFDDYTGGVSLIDDRELLLFNRRALEQRSIFTRILTIQQPLEDLLDGALTKIVIRASNKPIALAELDEMAINDTMLFHDLDGAARTAKYRSLSNKGATT